MDPSALTVISNLFKDFGPWTFSAFLFYLWRQTRDESREDLAKRDTRITQLEDSRLALAQSTAQLAEKLSDAVDDVVALSRSKP